jgi:hypothetical protein
MVEVSHLLAAPPTASAQAGAVPQHSEKPVSFSSSWLLGLLTIAIRVGGLWAVVLGVVVVAGG